MKPAILQTFRKNGSPYISPVWFREHDGAFEIVIAEGDPKLSHLRRDPRCTFMAFEAEPPFAGVKVEGEAELVETDVTEQRAAISGRISARTPVVASPSPGRSRACSCGSRRSRDAGICGAS